MKQAQISPKDAQCIQCEEAITNPICPDCLAKEMESWNPKTESILLTSSEKDTYMDEGVRCLFCGNVMNICAHCYSRDVYDLLVNEFPKSAEEFIETFNFGLKEELF